MIKLKTMRIRETVHSRFKKWADKRGLKFSFALNKLLDMAEKKFDDEQE